MLLLQQPEVAPEPIPELTVAAEEPWELRERQICPSFLRETQQWTRPVLLRGLSNDSASVAFWRDLMAGITSQDVKDVLDQNMAALTDWRNISEHWELQRGCSSARKDSMTRMTFAHAREITQSKEAQDPHQGPYLAFHSIGFSRPFVRPV
jgi:hypothetical protein